MKPFVGMRVLNSTPVFRNSLAKLLPLIAGGAAVEMCLPTFLPFDPVIVKGLASAGMKFVTAPGSDDGYDLVLDCAGSNSHVHATRGAVELTKSGEDKYANANIPWYAIDRSHLKLLEDMEGTADGFMRALEKFGCEAVFEKRFLLIGFGKVGQGIAARLIASGANVHAFDLVEPPSAFRTSVKFTPPGDMVAAMAAVRESDFIVTATGVEHCVQLHYPWLESCAGDATVFINMGATDEFGPSMHSTKLWAEGIPLNFSLEEPTRLRFLDPVFALQNACAARLATSQHNPRAHVPSHTCQKRIFDILMERGTICLDSVSRFF